MAQTTFLTEPVALFEGQRGAMAHSDVTAARRLVAAETIKLGKAVVLDVASGDDAIKKPSGATDQVQGVTYNAGTKELAIDGTIAFVEKDVVPIVRRGRVGVTAEQTVTPADPVFVRFTTNGANLPGNFRKDADAGAVGVKRKQTLTISGALDGGRQRVQKLVLDGDLDAADTVDGTIDGQAIAQVTFAVSHSITMAKIVKAIKDAAEAAALAAGGDTSIQDVFVTGATDREIHIISRGAGAAQSPLTGWATGGGATSVFASTTGADVIAGKAAHSLSVTLDGGAALLAEWRGTGDATLQGFADLLGSQAAIESAVVSHVTDPSGAPLDDADRVITVTSAAQSPTANVFAAPTVAGGVTARTMAVAETQAGVASGTARAVEWTRARYIGSATAGDVVEIEVNLP